MIKHPLAWERYVREKYLGVPYEHRGRSANGLDCWGLIVSVYQDFGVDLFDLDHYTARWHKEGGNFFIEHAHENWQSVDAPQFPDGVLFQTARGIANHAGIVLSDRAFLHAIKGAGVVVTRLADRPWCDRLVGFYRCCEL